ncbi:MAG: LysR substrate-binding domain-containing protein [Proteobacteria bacterium]|nr:LysR substrate-binding domain-containing protein [Pseudomonadota bacterium]MDA0926479.1 LysR substrate-binding domain-containing protein [Pseudomonadota bacterium]
MDLNGLYYFVHVVEKKGFAPAGRALDIPKSRLSRGIQQLEEQLNVRLIQRTSRQFQVTDVGKAFYHHARSALDEVAAARAVIERHSNTLSGRIRLSCSVGMAQFAIKDIVSRFLSLNPEVEIIQQVTNQPVDMIEEGLDLVIRAHTGPLPDSSLIQRHLAPAVWGLFASPTYLEEAGTPKIPEQLAGHAGLKLGWKPELGYWSLKGPDGSDFSLPYKPRLCSDDMVTLKHSACAGLGIIGLPAYICRDDLKLGRLVRILPEWTAGDAEISLLMPSRQGVMPVVTAFANYLRKELPLAVAT